MANEAKQFTINGVTHDVMDVGARQLIADLQTAIDAITRGDTTTAIKTFQEVIDFLDGVTDDATLIGKLNELRTLINTKYTKPNTGIPASDLADGVIPDAYTKTETDNAIANAVEGLGGGSVESVTINGTNHTPTNGVVDLGTIVGQQGPKGDSVVLDTEGLPQFEIANNLDSSDPTQGLSARQGKILKQNVKALWTKVNALINDLAAMAFTGTKTSGLGNIDWTGGTFYATINKSLTGCTATDNTDNGQIAEGSTLTMQLTASSGYTLSGATISVTDSRGQAVAYTLADNTITIAGTNVVGTININVAAKAIHQVSLGIGSSHVSFANGTTTEAVDGSSWSGTIEADSGYTLPSQITVTMGGSPISPSYNASTGAISIASVTGAVVITAVAEEIGKVTISKTLRNVTLADNADGNNMIAEGSDYAATIAAITKNVVDLYRKYADASPHANFTNYGTPMKVVQSPAGVVASGASITYNQDGTASVVKDDIDADLAITAAAESRIKAGYGYNSGTSYTPAEYTGKGCTESIIPIPDGINYLEWKHNAATNGYTSIAGSRGGINLNVLLISAGGAFTSHKSVGIDANSGDITYAVINQSNANLTKFIFASFPIGSTAEQQRALLDECYIKGYTVPDPSNPDITGLTPVVLFDGSKSEII